MSVAESAPLEAARGTSRGSGSLSVRLSWAAPFFTEGGGNGWSVLSARRPRLGVAYRDRWQHDKVVRSTHGVNCTGLVLVERLRQGRADHLGDPADRLPVQRPATSPTTSRAAARAARRSPGTSTRRCASKLPVRARRPARALPRGARAHSATRSRRGPSIVEDPETRPRLQVAARQGRLRARLLGGGRRADRRRARAHDPPHGPDRVAGFSPIPAMSMVSYAAGTRFLSLIGGVCLSLLRLVRRPAAGLAADLGRPDRRARVGRLVERELPDRLGHEHPEDADAGRALHDRGALPRPEGRRRLARLRRAHQVRRPLAARRGRAPTARWRWRWAT